MSTTPATQPAEVDPVAYPDLGSGAGIGNAGELDRLADVDMHVTVELGRVRLKVRDLLRLVEGSVVELDRAVGTPVDVLVNGTIVARGDVVVIDNELGIRISEFVNKD